MKRLLALVALVLCALSATPLFAAPPASIPAASVRPSPNGPNPNDPSSTAGVAGPITVTGALEITTPYGQPLELEPHGGGFVGQFSLRNGGAKPLNLKELLFRSNTDAPDLTPDQDLAVKAGQGATGPIKLQPGETRKVSVVWTPSKLARLKQIYAQVLVQPEDSPVPLQVVNVHATRETSFPLVTDHPLGWLIFLPLLGALLTALLGLRGAADAPVDPRIRLVGVAVTFAQLLVAVYTWATFDPTVTRVVGNEGLQHLDRVLVSRAAGIELALGVDGLGVVLVALVALASFLAIVVMPGADETRLPTHAESRAVPLVLLVSASAMAFFTVGDALLLVLFGAILLLNAVRLLGAEPTREAQRVARRLGSTWILGLVLLAVAVTMLRAHSGATFLLDGTHAPRVSSIVELARQNLVGTGAMPGNEVKECFLLLLAAALLLSPLTPVGGGLLAAITPRRDFAGGAIPLMLSGALAPAGMYVMLRVVAPIVPEAVRWAGPATATLGALLFAAGAIAAWVTPSLERRAVLLAGAQTGAALLGVGSLTQEGIGAAYLLTVAPAIALLFLHGFGLRGARSGQLAFGIGVVFACALVGPGAWGALLAGTGALASTPVASVIGWLAFALGVGVGVFGFCRVMATRASARPKARSAWSSWELGSGALILLLAALLTVWPAGLMAPFAGTLRDSVDRLDPPGPDQIAAR
jgi:NADH:ubiquinone oxidoreductase subunit 4 (subunit M)